MYKAQIAGVLPLWLEKLYELEAMISLANFAYLNPDYVFPELNSPPLTLTLSQRERELLKGGLEETLSSSYPFSTKPFSILNV